jgi:hypothetical protein
MASQIESYEGMSKIREGGIGNTWINRGFNVICTENDNNNAFFLINEFGDATYEANTLVRFTLHADYDMNIAARDYLRGSGDVFGAFSINFGVPINDWGDYFKQFGYEVELHCWEAENKCENWGSPIYKILTCICADWQSGNCINDSQRQQTRICNPTGCNAETQIIGDSTCYNEPHLYCTSDANCGTGFTCQNGTCIPSDGTTKKSNIIVPIAIAGAAIIATAVLMNSKRRKP